MLIRILALLFGLIAFGIVAYIFVFGSLNPVPYLLAAIALLLIDVAMLVGHATHLLEVLVKQSE